MKYGMFRLVSAVCVGMLFQVPAWSAPCYFNGFFVGGQGVIKQSIFNASTENSFIAEGLLVEVNTQEPTNFNRTKTHANVNLLAGYSHTFNHFYLGGKVIKIFGSSDKNTFRNFNGVTSGFSSAFDRNIDFSLNQSYGVSIMPGYVFGCDTLFYVEVGSVHGRLNLHTTDTYLAAGGIDQSLSISRSKTANKWGLKIGVGVEKYVTDCFTIGLAANSTSYSGLRTSVTGSALFPGLQSVVEMNNKTRSRVYSNAVEFTVNYRI